jgi:hypothetical protein
MAPDLRDILENKQVLVEWLISDAHLLLRDFGPCGKIFMNVCVIVAMVMLFRDFGPFGII